MQGDHKIEYSSIWIDKDLQSLYGQEILNANFTTHLNLHTADEAGAFSVRSVLLGTLDSVGEISFSGDVYEAYGILHLGDNIRVYLGRQTLPLGASYFFNPVDAFNILVEEGDETKGRDSISLRGALGSSWSGAAALLIGSPQWGEAVNQSLREKIGGAAYISGYIGELIELGLTGIDIPGEARRYGIWGSTALRDLVLAGELAWDDQGQAWLASLSPQWSYYGQNSSVVLLGELIYQQRRIISTLPTHWTTAALAEWSLWDRFRFRETIFYCLDDQSFRTITNCSFLTGGKIEFAITFLSSIGQEMDFYDPNVLQPGLMTIVLQMTVQW
jgi:hypothetical protein